MAHPVVLSEAAILDIDTFCNLPPHPTESGIVLDPVYIAPDQKIKDYLAGKS
jgi:hypothetical protein